MNDHALVLFSGGQDSTTCLAWALQRYARVETIGFAYGQRHAVEMDCRPRVLDGLRRAFPAWAERLGDDHVLDLSLLGQISDTALTSARHRAAGQWPAQYLRARPQPAVPGLCSHRGLPARTDVLVGGMCETDYSGYPDCRDNTLKAMQVALSLGLDAALVIERR
jgi:7-cyano-7-deazaguanine synthase